MFPCKPVENWKLFCHQVTLNINRNIDVKTKKRSLVFNVNPETNNSPRKVLSTQTNTGSKNCRFISVCKKSQ